MRQKDRKARRERDERRAATINSGASLGWRINEWCALVGCSRPTVWRHNRAGKLKLIYIGEIPFIPRSEAVRLGFIDA